MTVSGSVRTTLSGTLPGNYKISIADGATVVLDNVSIAGNNSAGLTCLGDATILLYGTNTVQGIVNHPGIHVAPGKTLTIRGFGSLTAKHARMWRGHRSRHRRSLREHCHSGWNYYCHRK